MSAEEASSRIAEEEQDAGEAVPATPHEAADSSEVDDDEQDAEDTESATDSE
jgi:hypothetical protein